MSPIDLLNKSPLCLTVDAETPLFDAGLAYAHKRKLEGGLNRRLVSDLADIRTSTVNPVAAAHKSTVFQYIDLAEVDETLGSIMSYRELAGHQIGSSKVKFRHRDVLFAKIRPSIDNKKVAYVHQELDNAVASTEFIVLTAKSGIDPLYLYAVMRSDEFTSDVIRACGGDTGRQRIKPAQLLALTVPWPEQEVRVEIAAKFLSFINALSEAMALRQQALEIAQEAIGSTTMRTAEPRRKRTKSA